MAESNRSSVNDERPAIHVSVAEGLDQNLFDWVAIGAEEEGVPCRRVVLTQAESVAGAYEAAVSSRFGVGVGVASGRIVVHELHMPVAKPVLTFEASAKSTGNGSNGTVSAPLDLQDNFKQYCRLAGSNAARLIIRLPLRFEIEPEPPVINPKSASRTRNTAAGPAPQPDQPAEIDPALVKAIAKVIVRLIKERGIP
ncbi:MAG TPA: glycerol dehydratase reactivase beta/small subunit family protein [Anaerolineae bacterium]|nr:glycerol dehydratase reactivase beta/small subunit family protein [Anaerolineae bacterium]HMR65447.1 glycerol dehydratase reactivase beta/small subunit family protein [Anaerolineae bacterium]